ncbi:MAG: hypothetical protein Q9217_005426 [Psora testacea]
MSTRAGARTAHSSRSVRSQFNPSESCTYGGYSVDVTGGRTHSRPRGFQPSEVRKSDQMVGATSSIEAGEVSHQISLSHQNDNSQTSATLTIQGFLDSKPLRRDSDMPLTAPHRAPNFKKDTFNLQCKATSPSALNESSSVQILTDEQKPSCWARGIGSGSSCPRSSTAKSEWGSGLQQVDKDLSWNRPESDVETHLQSQWRADFGKLPKYHFPGGRKQAAANLQSSFEKQNAYFSPRDDATKPATQYTSVALPATLRGGGYAYVPPHLRPKVKNLRSGTPPSRHMNQRAQVETSESPRMLTQMGASVSSDLRPSKSREANEHKCSMAAEPEVDILTSDKPSPPTLQPQASSSVSQHQPDTLTVGHPRPHAPKSTPATSLARCGHPKTAFAPHHRAQKPMNSHVANEPSNDRREDDSKPIATKSVAEPHNLGSGLDISKALKDITNRDQTETSNHEPDDKQAHSLKGFPNDLTRGRTASNKKAKRSQWKDPHYETQLVDYNGDMVPAPIGDEWHVRDKYDNAEERLAVLQEYAEDQAIYCEQLTPAIDINSPSFLAGHTVPDDVRVEESEPDETQSAALPPNAVDGRLRKAYKTADDAIKEYAERLEKSSISEDHTKAPMTKEQKRDLRRALLESERNFVPTPNPHTPVANIYLRPVEPNDVRQITDIWNHYVRTSAAVPIVEPDEQLFWRTSITEAYDEKLPFIVAILMGHKASRNQHEVRRLKQEHIVGFARATDFGYSTNAYRYTVELDVYVQDGHLRKGIGKTLFDRMMGALATGYSLKEGAPFLCADGLDRWIGGGHRIVKTILVNVLHHDGDEDLAWKKSWLESEEFQQSGFVPKIAYKLGKPVNLCQFYYETLQNITPIM